MGKFASGGWQLKRTVEKRYLHKIGNTTFQQVAWSGTTAFTSHTSGLPTIQEFNGRWRI